MPRLTALGGVGYSSLGSLEIFSICPSVEHTKPGSSWQPAVCVHPDWKHVLVCIWTALLVHPKEYLRVFHFWFLQGFYQAPLGYWEETGPKVSQEWVGTQKPWVLALLQNLLQKLEQPCRWPGRAASAAGLVCRRGPLLRGLSIQSKVCWLPGAPSRGHFIHIIVSNLLMQAGCKYKEKVGFTCKSSWAPQPAAAFQEEMRQLCCWASTSPLHVFVIGLPLPEHRSCWLFVFLRQSALFFPSRAPTQP